MAIASFSPGAGICFRLTNNKIGVLSIGDTPNPLLALINPDLQYLVQYLVQCLGGKVALELPTDYDPWTNTISSGDNTIAEINPVTPLAWSRTSIPQGSCK